MVERLAVLPLENLSADPQLSWYSRTSPAAVEYDLAGAKTIFAKAVESLSAAQSMQATRVLEGYFFERNGRIEVRATLEDLRKTRSEEQFEIEGPVAGGFLPFANELARRLNSGGAAFWDQQRKRFPLLWRSSGSDRRCFHREGLSNRPRLRIQNLR